MKKLLVLLFVLTVSWAQAQSETEMMAKHFAEDYYIALQRIAEVVGKYPPIEERHRPDEAIHLEITLINMFGKDDSDDWPTHYASLIRVSNDIDHIFGSDNSARKDLPFTNYIGHYMDYAEQLKFSLEYTVVSCEQLEAPSLKGVESDEFVKVVVDKTFRWGRKTAKVKETMVIRLSSISIYSMSICSIENSYGTP